MPKCIILRGIPCSGKSTWIRKKHYIDHYGYSYKVLSCDKIRIELSNGKYVYSKSNEESVWKEFYLRIEDSVKDNENFIIDNTNLKEYYINQITSRLTGNYEIEIVTFHISLWKANLRNIIRRIKTGKWIPFKVMKSMYINYKKLKI